MDAAIGRVLAQLDESQLTDNSLLVFFSDNGAFMLKNKGLEVASNGPLRDGGVTLFEGGIRVPCIVRWPGRLPAGSVCREPLLSCDFLPMAIAAAGGPLPHDRTIDGRDPTATLAGNAASPHDALFFEFRKHSARRRCRWKLVRADPKHQFQLFDLQADRGETTNLASRHPQLVAKMQRAFEKWQASVGRN